MKGKIVFLFVLFVLMQSIFTGCGAGKINIAPSGGKALQTFKDKGTTSAIPIGENTGVITDTVVDVFREPDVQSERVTQAIYNQPANILEVKDNWSRMTLVDGYTGWLRSKYIDKNCKSITSNHYKYRIVVTDKTKKIYSSAKNGVTLKDVVMGTELLCIEKIEDWYQSLTRKRERVD